MRQEQERSATAKSSSFPWKRRFVSARAREAATHSEVSKKLTDRHSRAFEAHEAGRKIKRRRLEIAEEHFRYLSAASASGDLSRISTTATPSPNQPDLSGSALCRKLSDATDLCVKAIFRAAIGSEEGIAGGTQLLATGAHGNEEILPVSLVATGGYGRREVCPYSDIDLIVCYLPGVKGIKEIAASILYPLWDSGIKIGHSVMAPKEAVGVASSEMDAFISYLDGRHITGAAAVSLELSERIDALVAKRQRRILDAILARRSRRIESLPSFDGLRCGAGFLKTDLKLGSGGLRDICAVEWFAKCLRIDVSEALSPEDLEAIRQAKSDLLLLRAALHLCYGRQQDRLDLDVLARLEARLGEELATYLTKRALRASLVAERITEKALGKLLERADRNRVLESLTGLPFSKKLGQSKPTDEPLGTHSASDAEAIGILVDSLSGPLEHIYPSLASFQVSGALAKVIPEWKDIEGLYQKDPYHTFTVDVHSMTTPSRLLYSLEKAVLDSPGIWPPGLVEHLMSLVENENDDRTLCLRLACLLHDIGKNNRNEPRKNVGPIPAVPEEAPHSEVGAQIAHRVAGEIGLSATFADRCAALVKHHLLLGDTATMRDIHDPATIESVCSALGEISLLDDLYLLTLADASATGPQAWNSWRRSLLTQLYLACRSAFEESLAPSDSSLAKRTEKARALFEDTMKEQGIPEAVVSALSKTAPAAFVASSASNFQVVARALLKHLAADRIPAAAARPIGDGYYELAVVAEDAPGLFAKIAGSIALANMSVHSAKVHTIETDPPLAVDLFQVQSPSGQVASEEGIASFEERLRLAISGKIALSYRLSLKTKEWRNHIEARTRRARGQKDGGPLPGDEVEPLGGEGPPIEGFQSAIVQREALVHVDSESSRQHTIIEIKAPNRPRLLYDVARTLAELGLDIRSAKISTLGETAADVFYVTDSSGSKLQDPAHISEVRKALAHTLGSGI